MNLFIEQHQKLLEAFVNEKVEFIVIGGYAVIFHGYPRTTGDADLWIKPDNSNKPKIIAALKQLNIEPSSLKEIETLDFTKHLVFTIWEEPAKVDFLTRISGVTYEEADKEKITADIEGLKINFLHLNHLVLSTMSNSRLKDKADIDELQRVQKYKKK